MAVSTAKVLNILRTGTVQHTEGVCPCGISHCLQCTMLQVHTKVLDLKT